MNDISPVDSYAFHDPRRRPRFAQSDNALLCPACGGRDLHHQQIRICSRVEDADATQVTTVGEIGEGGSGFLAGSSWAKVTTELKPSKEAANPSARRDGLSLAFTCESCLAISVLRLAQHKGVTLVDWGIDSSSF
jgi:hypothetical protein